MQFCAEVAPGEGAVKDCLEDNMLMAGFSEDCSQWLGLLRADRSGVCVWGGVLPHTESGTVWVAGGSKSVDG